MIKICICRSDLNPCLIPAQSSQSKGISESFAKTLKRYYAQITPLQDARTALGLIRGWIKNYNDNHPRSELKMHSTRKVYLRQNRNRQSARRNRIKTMGLFQGPRRSPISWRARDRLDKTDLYPAPIGARLDNNWTVEN